MKFGVMVFPGSNCDHDTYNVIAEVARQPVTFLWHDSDDLQGVDAVLVPGGFAYGDYLRTGAIARFSPVMQSVKQFAAGGGLVLGICNGFQILTESGLLPGALMRNAGLKYICKQVHLRWKPRTPPSPTCAKGEVLKVPIGHMEGNYFCDERTAAQCSRIASSSAIPTPAGELTAMPIPTGPSTISPASQRRLNVLGMMPHPDRSSEPALGMMDRSRFCNRW